MSPAQIASLIATLIPSLLSAYQAIAATDASIPPLATILGQADANWNSIETAAQGQLTLEFHPVDPTKSTP